MKAAEECVLERLGVGGERGNAATGRGVAGYCRIPGAKPGEILVGPRMRDRGFR